MSSAASKQGKRRGKKRCDRGADCPWKGEYQHDLEFSHCDDEPTSNQKKISSQSFKGKGHQMKSSTTSRNPYESSRCKVARAAEARSATASSTVPSSTATNKKRSIAQNSANLVDLISPSPPRKKRSKSSVSTKNSSVVVDLCDSDVEIETSTESSQQPRPHKRAERQNTGGRVAAPKSTNRSNNATSSNSSITTRSQGNSFFEPTASISRRWTEDDEQRQLSRALAESNRAVLREQDSEYEESLRQDKIKERQKREEDELQRAIEASERLHEEEIRRLEEMKHQTAIQQLEPEPPEGSANVATIAFKLPSRCQKSRITRRFMANAYCEQMIFFLSSCHDLDGLKNWKLVEVVGGDEVRPKKTIEELNLTPRGLLIVKDLDR